MKNQMKIGNLMIFHFLITFEGTQLPGLRKIIHDKTSSNLNLVEPLGNLLTRQ